MQERGGHLVHVKKLKFAYRRGKKIALLHMTEKVIFLLHRSCNGEIMVEICCPIWNKTQGIGNGKKVRQLWNSYS